MTDRRPQRRKRYYSVSKRMLARNLKITPLGNRILRAVDRGTYVFAHSRGECKFKGKRAPA